MQGIVPCTEAMRTSQAVAAEHELLDVGKRSPFRRESSYANATTDSGRQSL